MNTKNPENNPYLNAKRTWNDYISSEIAQRKLWQIVALLSLCGSLFCIIGIIYIGSLSKFTPYVIEVDKLGRSQYSGTIQAYDSFHNPKIINIMLNDFISDFRSVSSDKTIIAKTVQRLYSKVQAGTPAQTKLGEYFNAKDNKNNPFVKSEKENVSIVVNSILKLSEDTYQIEWNEISREPKAGNVLSSSNYKGNFTIYYLSTEKESFEKLLQNPLGLYIKDFDYQKIN